MTSETYLTLVFDAGDMDLQEIKDLTHRRDVSYMAWGHVPYELKKQQLDVISAVESEREACAKVCEGFSKRDDDMGAIIATAIRKRSEK